MVSTMSSKTSSCTTLSILSPIACTISSPFHSSQHRHGCSKERTRNWHEQPQISCRHAPSLSHSNHPQHGCLPCYVSEWQLLFCWECYPKSGYERCNLKSLALHYCQCSVGLMALHYCRCSVGLVSISPSMF